MSFQLSLPASLLSQEASHTMESLALGAPGTLTVEAMTRQEKTATAQRAFCRLGGREPSAGSTSIRLEATAASTITFTA